jgi:predicted ATPase/DNA-binding SARP family transcriptional activator
MADLRPYEGDAVDFRILGPLEAVHGENPLSLGGPRHRRLLAALLLNADALVPSGRLVAALWGDEPPRSAQAMLHVRVCELRAALRPGRPERNAGLLNRDGGYQLRLGADGLDAREFERLAAAGARALAGGDPETARTVLADALACWRGPAVAEFADEPFARADVARLEEARLLTLRRRLDADLATGRHGEIIGELEGLVVEHPLREQFWSQLMLALYRAGRSAEAVRAFQSAREILADQLGLDPGDELYRRNAAILRRDPSLDLVPPAGPPRPRGARSSVHLPAPLTSFVGRDTEIAEIGALVRGGRLVTLTGVGGVGKSRLALEVASRSRDAFPDGVWLVELATLGQDGLVPSTVANALGLREHPQRPAADLLVARLAGARALLVLDNCEHLVAEVADLADRLLRACPGLHVLATSRERLGITGEVLLPVEGLGVPGPDATTADVATSDAARLLVERAAAVQPGFALTDATTGAVAQICRRLDGLPLAIELAAAGVNAYGVDQIAARLDDRFGLLTRGSRTALPRHQTLRAVVEWSYERLPEAERRLFDRLAVFVGGFTLADAEAVCAPTGDGDLPVGDLLARLIDTSLVGTDGRAPARYRMLETLRAYGSQRLADTGSAEAVRARHATRALSVVESARGALHGAQQPEWLDRLEGDLGNIRAALEWSIGRGDAATAVRLAGSLYPLWDQRGRYREGRRWLDRALALGADVPPLVRARALNSVAGLAVIQGDLAPAAAASEEAAELSRRAGDPAAGAYALQMLGLTAIYAGDLDRAVPVLEESLHNARLAGDRWLEGFTLLFLTVASLSRADYAATARLTEECDAVLRTVGDPEGLAWVWVMRSVVAWQRRDRAAAAAGAAGAIRGFGTLGHRWGISIGLFLAGQLVGDGGDREAATALLAASEKMRESVGAAILPFVRSWLDGASRVARAELGPERYERARQAGRSMSGRDAIAAALRQVDEVSVAAV